MTARFVYPLESALEQAIASPLQIAPILIEELDDAGNHVRFIHTTWKRLMIERELIRKQKQEQGFDVVVLPKFNSKQKE